MHFAEHLLESFHRSDVIEKKEVRTPPWRFLCRNCRTFPDTSASVAGIATAKPAAALEEPITLAIAAPIAAPPPQHHAHVQVLNEHSPDTLPGLSSRAREESTEEVLFFFGRLPLSCSTIPFPRGLHMKPRACQAWRKRGYCPAGPACPKLHEKSIHRPPPFRFSFEPAARKALNSSRQRLVATLLFSNPNDEFIVTGSGLGQRSICDSGEESADPLVRLCPLPERNVTADCCKVPYLNDTERDLHRGLEQLKQLESAVSLPGKPALINLFPGLLRPSGWQRTVREFRELLLVRATGPNSALILCDREFPGMRRRFDRARKRLAHFKMASEAKLRAEDDVPKDDDSKESDHDVVAELIQSLRFQSTSRQLVQAQVRVEQLTETNALDQALLMKTTERSERLTVELKNAKIKEESQLKNAKIKEESHRQELARKQAEAAVLMQRVRSAFNNKVQEAVARLRACEAPKKPDDSKRSHVEEKKSVVPDTLRIQGWEFEGDGSAWQYYRAEDQACITAHLEQYPDFVPPLTLTVPVSFGNAQYLLDFATMHQTRLGTGVSRKIRLKEDAFVLVPNPDSDAKHPPLAKEFEALTLVGNTCPHEKMNKMANLTDLEPFEIEYQLVSASFHETLPASRWKITSIERHWSADSAEQYEWALGRVPAGRSKKQLTLWHGFKQNDLYKLLSEGLDPRLVNVKSMAGAGIYFSSTAAYSKDYAHVHSAGGLTLHTLLLCKVRIGRCKDYMKSAADALWTGTRAPPYEYAPNQFYDSVMYPAHGGSWGGSSSGAPLYCVYKAEQAYIAYVVRFHVI